MPMRRNAFFRGAMHFFRADLQFDPLPFRADYGRVQGPVHVRFRQRNVILKPTWYGFP